jgi:hypothetical protein
MPAIQNIPDSERGNYAAFIKARRGDGPEGQPKIGQGVSFRNHNWTIGGHDEADGQTYLRLVNADLTKEARKVEPSEVSPLIEAKPEQPAPHQGPAIPMGRGIAPP